MRYLIKVLAVALTLFLVTQYALISGISVSSFTTAVVVAFVLGILNLFIRPLAIILTLPVNILTLGLFTFVINALLFWFAAFFIKGFSVDGFVPAFLGALAVSIVKWLLDHLLD